MLVYGILCRESMVTLLTSDAQIRSGTVLQDQKGQRYDVLFRVLAIVYVRPQHTTGEGVQKRLSAFRDEQWAVVQPEPKQRPRLVFPRNEQVQRLAQLRRGTILQDRRGQYYTVLETHR